MKIVVLAGGLSSERNVSLVSGIHITQALREKGHQAVLVDLFFGTEGVDWSPETVFDALPPLSAAVIDRRAPDLEQVRRSRVFPGDDLIGPGVLALCKRADIVFLGLHGDCGEDGRLQAVFDLHGIAYTGSGYLGSALAMDKIQSKLIAQAAGVTTPAWAVAISGEPVGFDHFPCVAKIPNGGSSIGVAICQNHEELAAALEEFWQTSEKVLIEAYIPGREFTCGVLCDQALPSVEIIPKTGYFDYENKYQSGATEEICPSYASAEEEAQMRATALRMHRQLGLAVYSRTDYRLAEDGTFYYLETNTLPGMTPASLLPKEATAIGMEYARLCDTIVRESLRLRRKEP